MESFALAFLFLFQLILALAMLLLWWRTKDKMAAMELRASEALDSQDLMDFQERIASLLGQVREAGKDVVAIIDERRAGLDREGARARDAEKRLAEKIKSFERVEEKARKGLKEWAAGQSKRANAKKQSSKKNKREFVEEKSELERPALDDSERPHKVTYLKRDFRPAEIVTPVTDTATRYLKVYAMADEGLSREEIAKASGYLPGEVELILNLRPRSRG